MNFFKFFAFFFNALILVACCSQEDIPGLVEKLNNSSAHEKSKAAMDLASCGTKASTAVPRLAELLYDDNVGVQSAASYALRKIDTPKAREIMTAIDASRRKNSK